MTSADEVAFMEEAVNLARKCVSEDDLARPKVAAVVVKDGTILAGAYRGEKGLGEHAEYTALERKLKDKSIAGATVYTTLEPCTYRCGTSKLPCTDRLRDRKVARVVMGMLDPNQEIRGKGVLLLRKAGIEVSFFPHRLMAQLEELNRDFIRDQEKKTGTTNYTANIFWSGHDLMWTKHMIERRGTADEIAHGITQFIHQLSLSQMNHNLPSLPLLEESLLDVEKCPKSEHLREEEYVKLEDLTRRIRSELTGFIDSSQKGYKPYPEHNKERWYRMRNSNKT